MDLSAIESTELLANASQRAARNPHAVHHAPVSAYLDWALTPERFSHLVIPAKARSWLGRLLRIAEGTPQMTSHLEVALARRQEFLRLAGAGFGLLIGTTGDLEGEEDFLTGLGYSRVGASALLVEGAHDPLYVAWNRHSLVAAVQLAFSLPCRTICIFGHDGDPVYLLRSMRGTDDSVDVRRVSMPP